MSTTEKPAAPKRRSRTTKPAADKPAAPATKSKGLSEYQARRAAAAEKRAQAAAEPAPAAEPTGPSQDDIDDAVTALAEEMGGEVAPDIAARVAARAAEVKADQDANPKPKRGGILDPEAQAARDAKKQAQADRIAKVIEMRRNGEKLSVIAEACNYGSGDAVGDVLKRYAPDLVLPKGTSRALVLTAEQVADLQAVEAKYGVTLATLARALDRATKTA